MDSSETVTVYLCDDVPELRALMRDAFEQDPRIEVVGEAGEAFTAVEEVAELQPRIVLLDLSMPGMDGLEALPMIEVVAPDTGVIVFSGFMASRLEGIALASGADRYVAKGAALSELREMVLELADEMSRAL